MAALSISTARAPVLACAARLATPSLRIRAAVRIVPVVNSSGLGSHRGFERGEGGWRNRNRRGCGTGTLAIENEPIREHQISRLQILVQRSRKAGCNHEIRRRERSQRAPRRLGRPIYPEPRGDADDLGRAEPAAKSSQPADFQDGAVSKPSLESAGFARECVKNQDHQESQLEPRRGC